jgi:hypothetical protein
MEGVIIDTAEVATSSGGGKVGVLQDRYQKSHDIRKMENPNRARYPISG